MKSLNTILQPASYHFIEYLSLSRSKPQGGGVACSSDSEGVRCCLLTKETSPWCLCLCARLQVGTCLHVYKEGLFLSQIRQLVFGSFDHMYYKILCSTWILRNILYRSPSINFILKHLLCMVSKLIVMCEGSYLQNHSFRGHPPDHRITTAESQPA